MSVEGDPTSTTFYIDDLEPLYPAGDESKSQGDDHLRLIKKALKNTFGSVTAPVTASHTELNYVDVTTLGTQQASKAVTADANNTVTVPSGGEINFASGSALQIGGVAVTATAAELNFVSGVTSAIQTQLTAKQATITGAATTIDTEDLTASRALVSDASGKVGVSTVTSTELGTLSGIGSTAISTQLAAKQATITGAATTIDTENLTASRALVSNSSGKVEVSTVTSTELALLSGATSLGGLTRGTVVTPSGSASAAFTSLPSTIKLITLAFSALSCSTTCNIELEIGDSGGYETSGYVGMCTDGSTTEPVTTDAFRIHPTGASGTSFSGTIELWNVSGNIWTMVARGYDAGSLITAAGTKTLSGTLDRIQLYVDSGTFDAGSINIFYE